MTQKKTKAPAVKKSVAKRPAAKKPAVRKVATKKPSVKKASVVREGEAANKKATPIVFSLDDIEAIVASRKKDKKEVTPEVTSSPKAPAKAAKKVVVVEDKPVEKRVLGAASLADILGFNPGASKPVETESASIPAKWQKYYDLLLDLRKHLGAELDLHTTDSLQHQAGSEAGNNSSQDDSGTDSFDRDFALSLVSSEQDALNEVEEAIQRIKDGNYGICEVNGTEIGKERLAAVPFARFSIEGQAEHEKNSRRVSKSDRNAGGLFADSADAPKIVTDDDE